MPQVPPLNISVGTPSIQVAIPTILAASSNNTVSQTNRNSQSIWFSLAGSGGSNAYPSDANFSSISTANLTVTSGVIGLSPNTFISTIGNDLFYYNGSVLEQITATSSISSIAEWSYEPAISTVNIAGNNLIGVSTGEFSNIQSVFVNSAVGNFSSITATDIQTNNLYATSTIESYQFLNLTVLHADYVSAGLIEASSIKALDSVSTSVLESGTVSTGTLTVGELNYPEVNYAALFAVDVDATGQIVFQNKNTGSNAAAAIFVIEGNAYDYMGLQVNSSNYSPLDNTLFELPAAGIISHTIDVVIGAGSDHSSNARTYLTYQDGKAAYCINETGALSLDATYSNSVLNNGVFGNPGQALLSQGSGAPPVWGDISAISTLSSENILCSTLTAADYISTPSLFVSSINNHEFTENTATISTINTNTISSLVGDIQFQLVSTLQFSPNINPSLGGVNLGLGSILGNVIGWGAGVFGAVAGTAGLATGIAGLVMGRGTNNINSNNFEMVNGSTQLQVSTIGDYVSSIYRVSNGVPADEVPGEEVFISTIFAPGATLIRSYSDPINTMSTPNSTIQYFAPWTELPSQGTVSTFDDVTVLGTGVALPGNYCKIEGADDELFQFASYDNTSTLTASFQVGNAAGQYQCYTQFPLQVDNAVLVSSIAGDGGSFTAFDVSGLNVSSISFAPSTMLTSLNTDATLLVMNSTSNDFAQVKAKAYELSASGSNNTLFYATATDRLAVLDNVASTHTIAYTDDPPVFWSGFSSTTQSTIGLNLAVGITHDAEFYNVGGFTLNASTITVPQDGYYAVTTSLQFNNPAGGSQRASFWLRKNGVNVDNSASYEYVANNGETVGTVTIIEQANSNDTFEVCVGSATGIMNVATFAAVGDIPAVPSVITNIQKIK